MSSTPTDGDLFVLAFDHGPKFGRDLMPDASDAERERRYAEAKQLIFEALLSARSGAPAGRLGLLVDERYGSDLARRAKGDGLVLAMPVEDPDVSEFAFQHGDAFLEHIRRFDPDYVKVLLFHNPEGPPERRARQLDLLRTLSAALDADGRKLIVELLTEPTPEQLALVDGSAERFGEQLRPDLVRRAIVELYEAGIAPAIWKLEGFTRPVDAQAVTDAVVGCGGDDVRCIVLGSDVPAATLDAWLRNAAASPVWQGFAIGRAIFWTPIADYLAGERSREAAAAQIADRFTRLIATFGAHRAASGDGGERAA